jgi:hypothetical protein
MRSYQGLGNQYFKFQLYEQICCTKVMQFEKRKWLQEILLPLFLS